MKVSHKLEGDTQIALAHGRVDGSNAREFQIALEAVINDSSGGLILDCEELTYISSAGLRVFLLMARILQQSNRKFAICSLSPEIGQIFEISGFDKIIPIHDKRSGALDAIAN